MNVNDLLLCTFEGDNQTPKTNFVARILDVDVTNNRFECEFVISQQRMSFQMDLSGVWPGVDVLDGTNYAIDTHDIYTPNQSSPVAEQVAVVTFEDDARYLCYVESITENTNVQFYHSPYSRMSVSFDNQIVFSDWDQYPAGYNIVSIEGGFLNNEIATTSSSFTVIDCKSAEWDKVKKSFPKVHWEISPKREDNEKDEDYEQRKIEFKEKIHGVLNRVGVDPVDWFNSFTHITFLGITFNNPIHIELATHLTLVEKEFAKKYGGSNSSPKEAGRVLGIKESLKGGRKESTTANISMHTIGLALDVEYTNNPYLGGTEYTYSEALKKDIYIISKPPKDKPKKISVLDVIFKRAGILINGKEATYPEDHSYTTRLALYDELKVLNTLTIKYFNLVDNSTELTSLLSTNNVNEWKDKTVDEAIEIIKLDYDWFRGLVSRFWEVEPDKKKGIVGIQSHVIKKVGFLNLDRRFVDGLGLDWGATYGDIMHFDMRNKCIGKIIADNR